MTVSVLLSDRRFSIDSRSISKLVYNVLQGESASGRSLNIVYCSDRYMAELNRRFGGKDHITDVLAFDMTDGMEPGFIGEVYVNLQQARRQAEENGVSYEQEVRRLTVHGVLHLLGYSDEDGKRRRRMWARQEEYL